ncbi:glucosamine-6-phosphate isomerase [Staphylococcus gallinarum]|jgi:6-phosphogluconolactonase/glucosamine-6-phosphate isomerase/deaminase|uniref:Glucosamine-6-phosphate isomerase n=2 Tax=Staphylococcus gallinarum TaxID=1293 RepID=A0A0D0SN17_STAGA|nr:glucosamine-6-phosphate isomerase [Staphylococcus gallinarum]KIR10489.1 glucosamine-6-phosphate isomerase [Staphylococcus gallinarum]MCD8786822.1 glucosamine-6-phosphate isomerase [Staphylococcus gallinarum]MCD8819783.1 glucosamine-6-phosphate isomerase [Staphylococcus gallinarum]MCD8826235.1 glucosamine-6-phosphate isomerase [Staphylococcus gallinarum]MCD8842629.1 glucosamine-6-phosphate isomerase [Staphylococcus gallinarum]
MAMNFKILKNENIVAEYTADILRKQFNNNPTTIAGVHLSKDNSPVLDELKKNVDKHAVDFSQINILDYDNNKSFYEALGVPEGQIYEVSFNEDTESFIGDKIKTKENKGKLITQVLSIDTNGNLDISVRQGLFSAREIILVITGSEKQELVHKLYEENGKTSFEPSDLKAHRMVNVVLDEAAAQGLPEDVRHYFTARFA